MQGHIKDFLRGRAKISKLESCIYRAEVNKLLMKPSMVRVMEGYDFLLEALEDHPKENVLTPVFLES